jgi:hypothetical protein
MLLRIAAAWLFLGALAAAPDALAQSKAPSWTELSPANQQILAPLSGEWDRLDAPARARWLAVAKRYPKMTPTGQKRVQSRMEKWAKLTPEQRRQAREKYRQLRKREDLGAQWQQYQSLSPQERQSLRTAPVKPRPPRAAKGTPKHPAPPPEW